MRYEKILDWNEQINSKLRYNKLAEEEKQQLIRIMQKSEFSKSRISSLLYAWINLHAFYPIGIEKQHSLVLLNLELDDSMCTVMDYFGIFLERMMMCRRAAEVLGWRFKLVANGSKLC